MLRCRVVSYVRRHRAQEPEEDVEDSRWRYSLMSALDVAGPARREEGDEHHAAAVDHAQPASERR